jgi:hypothetical protein
MLRAAAFTALALVSSFRAGWRPRLPQRVLRREFAAVVLFVAVLVMPARRGGLRQPIVDPAGPERGRGFADGGNR